MKDKNQFNTWRLLFNTVFSKQRTNIAQSATQLNSGPCLRLLCVMQVVADAA